MSKKLWRWLTGVFISLWIIWLLNPNKQKLKAQFYAWVKRTILAMITQPLWKGLLKKVIKKVINAYL